MKNFLLTLTLVFTFVFSSNSQTFSLEGGSSSSSFPVNSAEKFSYSQFIYLGSEINNSGKIKSLTFKLTGTAPDDMDAWKNWKVSLAETENDEYKNVETDVWLSAKYNPYDGLTEVYNDDVVYDKEAKTIKITLSTAFTYDKSKNLLVEIYEQTDGATTGNTYFDIKSSLSKTRGISASSTTSTSYTTSSNIGNGFTAVPAIDIEIESSSTTTEEEDGSTFEFCEGNNLELTAEDAGTGATYEWTLPDGSTVNTKDLTINDLTSDHSGSYTLKVTQAGCSDTTTSDVTVNSKPKAVIKRKGE